MSAHVTVRVPLAIRHRPGRKLDDGRYASISEMAAAERIERGYLGSLLRLTLLAPDVVQAIIDGRAPDSVTLPVLLKPVPLGWAEQSAVFGIATPQTGASKREAQGLHYG